MILKCIYVCLFSCSALSFETHVLLKEDLSFFKNVMIVVFY